MKITDFCKSNVEGWDSLPKECLVAIPGKEDQSIGFLRSDGLYMIASIREDEKLHLSVAAMESLLPHMNAEERFVINPEEVEPSESLEW